VTKYLGIDLAWGEGTATKAARETGLVALDAAGTVLDAGWAIGIDAVTHWIVANAEPGDVIAIDAPLVVTNPTGMRECERETGQRYGRWRVAANASNTSRAVQGGVTLRRALEAAGLVYTHGTPARPDEITFFECYPYTTLVGVAELGYDIERPRYKRFDKSKGSMEAKRAFRATECDELLRRIPALNAEGPQMHLATHPVTAQLLDEPSPIADKPYKHREDLLDAALCAWTAALWHQHGTDRCQVLGWNSAPDDDGRIPVIIAPCRAEQRRDH
jgi:predicted RNase H-like nuclease